MGWRQSYRGEVKLDRPRSVHVSGWSRACRAHWTNQIYYFFFLDAFFCTVSWMYSPPRAMTSHATLLDALLIFFCAGSWLRGLLVTTTTVILGPNDEKIENKNAGVKRRWWWVIRFLCVCCSNCIRMTFNKVYEWASSKTVACTRRSSLT